MVVPEAVAGIVHMAHECDEARRYRAAHRYDGDGQRRGGGTAWCGADPRESGGGGVSAAQDDMGTIRGGRGVQGWKQAQQPRGYGGEDGSPHSEKNPHEVPFQCSDYHQDGQWIFRPEAVRGIRGTAYWLRSERQAVRRYKGLCCDG